MRLGVVRHLIAHARRQVEQSAVRQLSFEFTRNAEENMTLLTPMIRLIARWIVNQSHPNRPELPGAPTCHPDLTSVLGGVDLLPISNPEWNVAQVHDCHLDRVNGCRPTVSCPPNSPASAAGDSPAVSILRSAETDAPASGKRGLGGIEEKHPVYSYSPIRDVLFPARMAW
jgi:hypothetical protein